MSLASSPHLIKGGLVVLDALTGAVRRSIALQYNPDTLTRSYQVQGVGGEGGGERAQPFRLKGPAIETIKLDAEIDATDALEQPDEHAHALAYGIGPQLAALEGLVNPSSAELQALGAQAAAGTLEILAAPAPLLEQVETLVRALAAMAAPDATAMPPAVSPASLSRPVEEKTA